MGAQVGQDHADLVTAGTVILTQAHGHHGNQRLVWQGVLADQVFTQRMATHGQYHGIHGAVEGLGDDLEARQAVTLRCKPARTGDALIEDSVRRLKDGHIVLIVPGFLSNLVHFPGQPWHRGGLLAQPGAQTGQAGGHIHRIAGQRTGLFLYLERPARGHVQFIGIGGECAGGGAHGGNAIHHRMVNLVIKGKLAATDTFDQVALPQGTLTVHQVGMFGGNQ